MSVEADPELGKVREELDWAALDEYLRASLPVSGPLSVRQFPNGAANLTYLVSYRDWRAVLRRPPFGTIAPGAHDMRREYRVLTGLSSVFDRAPATLLECADLSVIGAPFFLMEYRPDGVVIRDRLPDSISGMPDVGERVSRSFATAVAELHSVDLVAVGLGELGRPDGFVERQLRGWTKRWEAVRSSDADVCRTVDDVARRLVETVPAPQRVSLVHSDLKLDNCQFGRDDPDRVVSIFDWDMTTLGDPLLDLGVMLNYWPDDGPFGALARLLWPGQQSIGLRSRSWMAAVYAERVDVDLSRLAWYESMAAWKTAIQLQQLAARLERGETTDQRMAHFATVVPVAARMASKILRRGG